MTCIAIYYVKILHEGRRACHMHVVKHAKRAMHPHRESDATRHNSHKVPLLTNAMAEAMAREAFSLRCVRKGRDAK